MPCETHISTVVLLGDRMIQISMAVLRLAITCKLGMLAGILGVVYLPMMQVQVLQAFSSTYMIMRPLLQGRVM